MHLFIDNSEYIDSITWEVGIAQDIVLQDFSYVLIDIHDVMPPVFKGLDETRGKVISDYQNAVEREWIANLKLKYPIKVNMEVVYSLVK